MENRPAIKRGDIFIAQDVRRKIRFRVVVVSGNIINNRSETVMVAKLKKADGKLYPTNAIFTSTGNVTYAKCDQIYTIRADSLIDLVAHATEDELDSLDSALSAALWLSPRQKN